jgi:hypothetical protein
VLREGLSDKVTFEKIPRTMWIIAMWLSKRKMKERKKKKGREEGRKKKERKTRNPTRILVCLLGQVFHKQVSRQDLCESDLLGSVPAKNSQGVGEWKGRSQA